MSNFFKGMSISAFIISLCAGIFCFVVYFENKTIYFVNNGKLYEGFTLKVEYENQIKDIRLKRKNMLDSVELSLKQLEAQGNSEAFAYAREYYIEKVRSFEKEEELLLEEYNQQIWKRLNQYAAEFSKNKKIDILFGANGNGTLLHANENIDLTEDLIKYSNQRYAGK